MTQLETSEQGQALRTSQASFHTQKNPLQTMQEDAPGKEAKIRCPANRAEPFGGFKKTLDSSTATLEYLNNRLSRQQRNARSVL